LFTGIDYNGPADTLDTLAKNVLK